MKTTEKGFSLIELLIVVAIILIIAAIAIPNLIRSKATANEASAVDSLHAINSACVSYSTTFNIGYPAAYSDLAPASVPTTTGADLLDAVLATGTKSGYTFAYTPGPVDAAGQVDTYTITASPLVPGRTGTRWFFTDNSFVIHWNGTTTASATDPPL
jgi:prepilin-type N-terminal cleavage/methylation domain-containing protein